ncbi:hypothetical protein LDENG_00047420 [Lucifuga dentata]|nr:hypothetical protein LDENG_00047420 [Lucifuga dentata]
MLLPPAKPDVLKCADHEDEKVNIYCVTCQVPTCSLCKVFGAHQSCQVAPLTDIYQEQKAELNEEVTSLVASNDKVQAFINELEDIRRNIEENSRTQKQNLCDRFERLFSILEERRKAMTKQISSEQEEKTGHAQSLVRCYGDSVEANNKMVQTAVSSMEEPDMAVFVQNSRELIAKLVAATGFCPAGTLKPGYENMSHFRCNFSRQERVLQSINFIKVEEEVPEEPEVEPEPEEPQHLQEQTVLILETKDLQEPSVLNLEPVLESAVEPAPEPVAASIAPPAAPVQNRPATAPGLVTDSVEPAGADLQPESDSLVLNDEGSGLLTESKKEKEEVGGEVEGYAAVKEGHEYEQQEGMSTQQCEGREAENDAGDWTTQRETEDKRDEEEEIDMQEEQDAMFYPSWYKPSRGRWVHPAPAEMLPKIHQTEKTTCPQQPSSGGDSLLEARDAVQVMSGPPTQPQPPRVQDFQLLSELQRCLSACEPHACPSSTSKSLTQAQTMSYLVGCGLYPNPQPEDSPTQPSHPQPSPKLETLSQTPSLLQEFHLQPQQLSVRPGIILNSIPIQGPDRETSRETGFTEKENEEEEEEDMQGWVCLSGAVDKGFGLASGSFDLGESSSCNRSSMLLEDTCPELVRSGSETGDSTGELRDGSVVGEAERGGLEGGILWLESASELKEKADDEVMNVEMEEGSLGPEERSKEPEKELATDGPCMREDRSGFKDDDLGVEDDADHTEENPSSLVHGNRNMKPEGGGLGFLEKEQEVRESSEQPEDAQLETTDGENKKEVTSSVSLQAVTLLFYLLAFLVILQRVWVYIGCFICT